MMAPSISQESMSLVPRRRLLEEFLTALRKVSSCTACPLFLHLRLPAHGSWLQSSTLSVQMPHAAAGASLMVCLASLCLQQR